MMRSKEQIEADIEATQSQMDAFGERLGNLYDELDHAEENLDIKDCAEADMRVVKTIEEVGFTQSEAVQLFCAYLIASALS